MLPHIPVIKSKEEFWFLKEIHCFTGEDSKSAAAAIEEAPIIERIGLTNDTFKCNCNYESNQPCKVLEHIDSCDKSNQYHEICEAIKNSKILDKESTV